MRCGCTRRSGDARPPPRLPERAACRAAAQQRLRWPFGRSGTSPAEGTMHDGPRWIAGSAASVLLAIGALGCVGDIGSGTAAKPGETTHATALGQAPLRRLNRVEYDNTVHDLFQMSGTPSASWPADGMDSGSRRPRPSRRTSATPTTPRAARSRASRPDSAPLLLPRNRGCALAEDVLLDLAGRGLR